MIITTVISLIFGVSMSLAEGASDVSENLNKGVEDQKVLIQKLQETLGQQNSELKKLQDTNKQLSQDIADMRDELLERPIDVEAERAKFAKDLETDLTVEKLTPEQKKEYDLYDSTLKWLKKNGIKFYFFEAPDFAKIKNLDKLYNLGKEYDDFLPGKNSGLFEKIFTCPKCQEYMKNDYNFWNDGRYFNGKVYLHNDYTSNNLSVIGGYRNDCCNNSHGASIYFYGPCFVWGISSDEHTIESFVSKYLKGSANVYNRASAPYNSIKERLEKYYQIRATALRPNDIVILIGNLEENEKLALKNNDIPYFELSHLFDGPNNYGLCFTDSGAHFNCTANRVIAKYIYQILKPEIEKYDEKKPREYVRMDDINDREEKIEYLKQNPDFKKFLYSLLKVKKERGIEGKVGSIVMHCNPFTLGHRYLIETAAKQVDKLVIFVVQEDAGSTYPFKDRFELVRKGVSDLSNVIVIPSSPFFASVATFPAYFLKGQKQVDEIDPSKDINIFAKYLAPVLGIKYRFVGDEPLDELTNKFNIIMGERLPEFGITLVKIPRKTTDGKDDVISASKVRKLSEEGKWEEVKKYVPETTLDYLKNLQK